MKSPLHKRSVSRNLEINMITLRFAVISWVRWIRFGNLTALLKSKQGHSNAGFFLSVWNAYHCAYFPPFTSFSASLSFSFPLCLPSFLFETPLKKERSESEETRSLLFCCLFCGFLSVTFSLFSSGFTALMFLVLMFWSSDETCLFASFTVAVSASVRFLLLFLFLTAFHQYSVISLLFSLFTTFGAAVFLFYWSSYSCHCFCPGFWVPSFLFRGLCSLSLVFSVFLCQD